MNYPPAAGSAPTHQPCPDCAEPIRLGARICRFCQYDLETHERPGHRDRQRAEPRLVYLAKSPGLAALFSFLFMGAGQIYSGFVGRGLLIMAGPIMAVFVFFFVGMTGNYGTHRSDAAGLFLILWLVCAVFYVWQIFDAYACAHRANRAREGRRTRRRGAVRRSRRRRR